MAIGTSRSDLSGGTLVVSLMVINGGVSEVEATSGDTHLGGEYFDSPMECFSDEFKRKHEKDINRNRLAVDKLCDKVEIFTTYSRARFEELYINTSNQTTTQVES